MVLPDLIGEAEVRASTQAVHASLLNAHTVLRCPTLTGTVCASADCN